MNLKNSERLGNGSIGPLLLQFSLPAIIGTMVFASTNIVNTIFIGRGVGSIALTATSLVFPIFSINMAIGMLVGMGGGALVSIRLGEQKKEEAERILGNCLFLFIVLSLILVALGQLFLDPLLRKLGASPESLPYAHNYMRILFLATPFNFLAMGLNNLIRAEGNPKLAMNTLLIGAVLNVCFNYLFVMHLHMGVQGAAYATLISSIASATWVIAHFISGRSNLTLHRANIGFDRHIMQPALFIGLAPFLMQLVASFVGVVANRELVLHGGDTAVASMGIIYSVMMLLIFPVIGINQGAQPIFGFNLGAKKYDRVRKTLIMAVLFASIIAFLGWGLIQLFPEKIIHAFSKGDKNLIAIGTEGMRFMMVAFFLVGFQAVAANYFQAIGRPKTAIILNILRQALLFIPLLIILPKFFGLFGIWISAPIADTVSFIITLIFFSKEMKRLKKLELTTPVS